MKQKIISKELVISSIILLLSLTPLIGATNINNNKTTTYLNILDNNFLGTVEILHQPGLFNIIRNKGHIAKYYPPDDNPTFDYYFPEDENGSVYLNFTLHVKHRLNTVGTFWAKYLWPTSYRFTMIDVWIADGPDDICFNESKEVCLNTTFDEYDMPISYMIPLYTNGNKTVCKFWITTYTIISPNPIIQDMCKSLLGKELVNQDIFINPT